jgi:hypothetical protein
MKGMCRALQNKTKLQWNQIPWKLSSQRHWPRKYCQIGQQYNQVAVAQKLVVTVMYGDSDKQTDDSWMITKKLASCTHVLTGVSDLKAITLYRKYAYSLVYSITHWIYVVHDTYVEGGNYIRCSKCPPCICQLAIAAYNLATSSMPECVPKQRSSEGSGPAISQATIQGHHAQPIYQENVCWDNVEPVPQNGLVSHQAETTYYSEQPVTYLKVAFIQCAAETHNNGTTEMMGE